MTSGLLLLLATAVVGVCGRLHYIPHSHMDMGWVETIRQYFDTSVRPIHDAVVDVLFHSPSDLPPRLRRKFVLNDLYFFRMWLTDDPRNTTRKVEIVRDLIDRGVLELVGTGMVMADTACPHYEDLITNYFAGIAFTETNFTVRSQTAFQLDSFGQTHALFYIGSLFGLHDAVFHRIPHNIRDELKSRDLFEFQWVLPFDRRVNVHINENYGWDRSFSVPDQGSATHIDPKKYEAFRADRSQGYRGSKMILFGDDFEYSHADLQFKIFDPVAVPDPTFTYSTMAEYLDDFYAKHDQFFQVSGDFMPYVDPLNGESKTGYQAWTGYFTAKPNLKHRIRVVNQMHRALMVWANVRMAKMTLTSAQIREVHAQLAELSADVSILMHHDCITGTAKREVDIDYYDRIRQFEERATAIFDHLIGYESYQCDSTGYFVGSVDCFWLREQVKASAKIRMTVINPTDRPRKERIRVAVPFLAIRNFMVAFRSRNTKVPVQTLCFEGQDPCFMEFDLNLPPHFKPTEVFLYAQDDDRIYELLQSKNRTNQNPEGMYNGLTLTLNDKEYYQRLDAPEATSLPATKEFETVTVEVGKESILIRSGPNRKNEVEVRLAIRKNYFSNAYITYFAAGTMFRILGENQSVRFYTSLLDEWGAIIKHSMGEFWVRQRKGVADIEVDFLLTWDKVSNFNYEIALFLQRKDISDDAELWVESNGLFEIQRKSVNREDYSIYPTTTKATLKHPLRRLGMAVWSDRARGVAAYRNTMHVFIQRSGDTGKGQVESLRFYERVLTKLTIHHFDERTSDEEEVALRSAHDLRPLTFFSKRQTNISPPMEVIEEVTVPENTVMPANVRMTVNIGKPGELILRFQNTSRRLPAILHAEFVLAFYYPQYTAREVDFAMVTNPDVTEHRPVHSQYTIEPVQFLTFWLSLKD